MNYDVTYKKKDVIQKQCLLANSLPKGNSNRDNDLYFDNRCETCEDKRQNMHHQVEQRRHQNDGSPRGNQTFEATGAASIRRAPKKIFPHAELSAVHVPVKARSVQIFQQHVDFGPQDPLHQPLIENYRRATGQPPGGIDEAGHQFGPSDAELKYSGLLGKIGSGAQWRKPIINKRNAAEVYFKSTPLIDPPGGLTTQFINEQEVDDNLKVMKAVPRPPIQSRKENGGTLCWFSRGISVSGRTTMDIFSKGPWRFRVTGAQAADRFASPECKGRTEPTTVRVAGHPNDKALEEYIRLGELEHEIDSEKAFLNTIAVYAKNVNNLVGDTPRTRMTGKNIKSCNAKLRRLENRDLLTDFVHQLNAATARRHAGGRHSSSISGLHISSDCSDVKADMNAGTL